MMIRIDWEESGASKSNAIGHALARKVAVI